LKKKRKGSQDSTLPQRTYAELNTLIFKVSTSFLARILKPTHHMVNLSNESDQA